MNKVFICSPYRGDVEKNVEVAKMAARHAANLKDAIPIAPHLYFPQFLDDSKELERFRGLRMGTSFIKYCDQFWIIGAKITEGMQQELNLAKRYEIETCLYDETMRPVDLKTVRKDERFDKDYRDAIKGLRIRSYHV